MKQFPLEEKMKELEVIEQYFEESEINLEEGIIKHEKALAIGKEIMQYLETVETKLEEVTGQSSFSDEEIT